MIVIAQKTVINYDCRLRLPTITPCLDTGGRISTFNILCCKLVGDQKQFCKDMCVNGKCICFFKNFLLILGMQRC